MSTTYSPKPKPGHQTTSLRWGEQLPPNPDRDKNMAFSFETKRRENPDDTVAAVLIGNFHNRRPTPSDVEWKPNFLSYLDEDNIVSLTLGASGGTAWICASGHHCGVMPWSPSRVSSEIKPGNIIMAPPGTGHYDGLLFIGGISPSPPAVKQ
jgi:hypothetical protein